MESVFMLLPPSNNGELYSRSQNFIKALNNLEIHYSLFFKKCKQPVLSLLFGLIGAILSSLKYDVIFIFISRQTILLIILYKFIFKRKVVLDHFATSETAFDKFKDPNLIKTIERHLYKHCDMVLTHSETMKKRLCKYYCLPKERVMVIYGVVDTELFNKTKSSKLIKKFKLNGKTVFIYHGLFHKWHGLEYFLRAVKNIINKCPNIFCIFIGATKSEAESYFDDFKNFTSNNIGFVPRVKYGDLPLLLSSGSYWIGRFKQDTFGKRSASFCMFEAMSMGLIPITSHSFENDRVIKDKVNGFLVREKNSFDIENTIYYLLKHKKGLSAMSKRTRNTILCSYSIKSIEGALRFLLS